MDEQSIAIFRICDEVVKSYRFHGNLACKMTDAEVMAFAIISALHYRKRLSHYSFIVVSALRYFPKILSHSHQVRRIHAIPEQMWMMIFYVLKMYLCKSQNEYFIVDSFPVKAYENHKSFRAKIFRGKEFHGYTASKKQYFFGINTKPEK